jgi:glycosyltransferase involved in cell wall biosynthesis
MINKMRVLILNSIGKNKFGGGEKWCLIVANGLRERGHRVFVGGRHRSQFLERALAAGLEVVPFTLYSDISIWHIYKVGRFLSQHKINAVLCNLNRDTKIAGRAARIFHSSLIIARHGIPLKNKRRYAGMLKSLASAIITNTVSIKKLYSSYEWFTDDFVKVIYNGVEDKSDVRPYDFSKDYPGKKVIFSAGRLAEQKGFIYLLQAALRIKEKRNDIVFVIAGKGKLEHELKTEAERLDIEDIVKFTGYVENIDRYIKGSAVFLLPSLYEGMSNAVMEAMALCKPVIATDVNGARELIVDGESGLIIPPKDPDAIARSVLDLLEDEEKRNKLGSAACERVRTRFTIPVMIDNLETFLQSKLDEAKNN